MGYFAPSCEQRFYRLLHKIGLQIEDYFSEKDRHKRNLVILFCAFLVTRFVVNVKEKEREGNRASV